MQQAKPSKTVPPSLLSCLVTNSYFCAALNMPANLEKLSSGHGTGKGQFSFQTQRKAMPKNAQTTTQLHSSHTLVK